MEAEGTIFAAYAMREVNALFERAVGLLECTGDLTLTGNRVLSTFLDNQLTVRGATRRSPDSVAAGPGRRSRTSSKATLVVSAPAVRLPW